MKENRHREIREKRKKQIMDVALKLFSSEGYGHVSIAGLAVHAGISKGLMYNYFDSKESLLKAIVEEGIDKIIHSFDLNRDGILTAEEFAYFIRSTFRLMEENKVYWTRFFGLIIQPNIKEFLMNSGMAGLIAKYFDVLGVYFKNMGFEDPMLEVFNLSVTIEGFALMMLFYNDMADIPEALFKKFEERIVRTYT
ncbi:MAG: TetR/AcrR family transcriptional regulator [Bacteroidales bacterium]|nr:TetR/AcrR family transcriptional regulator [Bacteroidales bacterium]